jgi:hypothetical protein
MLLSVMARLFRASFVDLQGLGLSGEVGAEGLTKLAFGVCAFRKHHLEQAGL